MADKFYSGQKDYIPQLNALWDRATTSLFGTSTSSLSLTTGSKTFTTNTQLQLAAGSQVTITYLSDLSKYMTGQVTAYNQDTGSITVNVQNIIGSGTFANWSVTLSGAAGATGAKGLNAKGVWNSATAYAQDDWVTYNGSSYYRLIAGTTGTDPATDTTNWGVLSSKGDVGASNSLSIGTVTTGTAAASITGTSPSQVLNLTLPTAPPNTLSIGTVTSGTAGASITGTAPNQTLNLVLQTGAKGDKGTIFRSAWSAATAYAVDDLSTYSGTTYIRLIAGTTATAPSSDSTNWAVFAAKGADGAGTVAGVTASAPLASTGGANPNITITQANTTTNGYLSNTDWNTFNNKQSTSEKDATSGYAGLTLFKINFKNAANTFTSFLTNINTAARTYTFQDRDGIIVDNTDLALKANIASPTFTGTVTFPSQTANTIFAAPNGASGVPTWRVLVAADIPALAYAPTAGSASITTLGTVSTGTWNATVIAGQYGGTGVNNSGKTITLGGNLTTSGAFASTFTMTATTNITFPTSGTLAVLGSNVFTGRQTIPSTTNVVVDKGIVSTGTVTFDVSAAENQLVNVGGALTIAFSNWAASGSFSGVMVKLVNGGSATITLPTINWQLPAGGFTTTFATYMTAIGRVSLQTSGTDFALFWSDDAGTTIYGKLV